MRKILFRGKQRQTGKWHYGFYYRHEAVKLCIESANSHIKHLIIYDGSCDWGFEPSMNIVEISEETLGQYTGMTDKNGKMIFEGDIIKTTTSNMTGEDVDAIVIANLGDYELMYDIEHSHTLEVIGNSCDNGELLAIEERDGEQGIKG